VPGGISPLQGGEPLVTFFVGVPDIAAALQAAVAQGGRVVQSATTRRRHLAQKGRAGTRQAVWGTSEFMIR
jgi:predicted enzyme related to lactoylglutathione lyase